LIRQLFEDFLALGMLESIVIGVLLP